MWPSDFKLERKPKSWELKMFWRNRKDFSTVFLHAKSCEEVLWVLRTILQPFRNSLVVLYSLCTNFLTFLKFDFIIFVQLFPKLLFQNLRDPCPQAIEKDPKFERAYLRFADGYKGSVIPFCLYLSLSFSWLLPTFSLDQADLSACL